MANQDTTGKKFLRETIWATLDQIAAVFGRDKSVISRHLRNIFKDGELRRDSVVAKNATTSKVLFERLLKI